ncbi:MAG: DUF58 domain-containing protein [Deltaproteobacteria bacterium]|nr:DUF58 domain-containing protein [Deltaproteobacteria bacterium]
MLTRELMSRLRRIEIKTSRLANREMAGAYRSVFKGHGMSFEEVRPYQQGDDVRVIDWNVSARTGDLFVKVFVEERELTVFLLLDMSLSADFGTRGRTRRDLVAEVAAVHAFSAIRNNDRVGLIIFTDRVEHFVPPKKGKTHVLRVIRDILEFKPGRTPTGASGIPAALGLLSKVTKKTSVAFLVSDFFVSQAEQEELRKTLSIASRRHDLVAFVTRDPADEVLPDTGLTTFRDLETGRYRLVDTHSAVVRSRFSRQAVADRARVESLLKRLSIDYAVLWTHKDYIPECNRLYLKRARRH